MSSSMWKTTCEPNLYDICRKAKIQKVNTEDSVVSSSVKLGGNNQQASLSSLKIHGDGNIITTVVDCQNGPKKNRPRTKKNTCEASNVHRCCLERVTQIFPDSILESTDSFQKMSSFLKVSSLRELIVMLNLESTFAGHLLIFVACLFSLVEENNPSICYNFNFNFITNTFMTLVYTVYITEKLGNEKTSNFRSRGMEDISNSFATKKRVVFSSEFCGGSISPPNERLENSWHSMLKLSRLLNCVLDMPLQPLHHLVQSQLYINFQKLPDCTQMRIVY